MTVNLAMISHQHEGFVSVTGSCTRADPVTLQSG